MGRSSLHLGELKHRDYPFDPTTGWLHQSGNEYSSWCNHLTTILLLNDLWAHLDSVRCVWIHPAASVLVWFGLFFFVFCFCFTIRPWEIGLWFHDPTSVINSGPDSQDKLRIGSFAPLEDVGDIHGIAILPSLESRKPRVNPERHEGVVLPCRKKIIRLQWVQWPQWPPMSCNGECLGIWARVELGQWNHFPLMWGRKKICRMGDLPDLAWNSVYY